MRVRGPEVRARRLARSKGCNGFIIRPLRHNFNGALNGDLHHILLSSLRNYTIASVGVSNILRRFSAVPNMGRSIARVILGVGDLITGLRRADPGIVRVTTRNPYRMGTTSVGYSSRIRVLGPRLRVTALNRNTGLGVRVAISGNEKCVPSRHGGRLDNGGIVNILPVSSVCAPILGMGCAISGAHMNRVASCSGLALSI